MNECQNVIETKKIRYYYFTKTSPKCLLKATLKELSERHFKTLSGKLFHCLGTRHCKLDASS